MMALDLFGWTVLHFVLAHAVWAIPIVFVAVLVIVPGAPATLFTFARSTAGMIVIAAVVAAVIGWELRAYLDASDVIRRDLVASQQQLATAKAEAAENRRQAAVARDIATAAASREAKARADARTLQEQVDDYADLLAAPLPPALSNAVASPARCALSADDARRLRGIGASSWPRRAAHPARRAG